MNPITTIIKNIGKADLAKNNISSKIRTISQAKNIVKKNINNKFSSKKIIKKLNSIGNEVLLNNQKEISKYI